MTQLVSGFFWTVAERPAGDSVSRIWSFQSAASISNLTYVGYSVTTKGQICQEHAGLTV